MVVGWLVGLIKYKDRSKPIAKPQPNQSKAKGLVTGKSYKAHALLSSTLSTIYSLLSTLYSLLLKSVVYSARASQR